MGFNSAFKELIACSALPLDLDNHSWSPDEVTAVSYLTLPHITLYYVTLRYTCM